MPRRAETLSSSIYREVLVSLERIFVEEGPDEPDLGLNISYLSSCRALSRLALAEPWEVPGQTADSIWRALARIGEMRDPHELEKQLLTFPVWVLRTLDRRRRDRRAPWGPDLRRRLGDQRLVASQGAGA